jgi:predicted PurR-regulated permease PerM
VWLLVQLLDVVLLVVVALIFAGTFSPLVGRLNRHVSRAWAVTAVVVVLLLSLGLFGLVTVPALVRQVGEFAHDAPELFHKATDRLSHLAFFSRISQDVPEVPVGELLSTYGGRLLKVSTAVAGIVGYIATAIVLAVYFLADPNHAKGVLFTLVPRSYHVRTARILLHLETIVGGYMRGQVITSAAMTAYMLLLLLICGVPNPLALAVFAGLADVLPIVGGIIAITPAALAASGQSLGTVLAVVAGMVVYQEFENRVLVPRIYGHALRLSPPAVVIALLVGGKLMGILGALLALPITAAILMMVQELRVGLPGEPAASPDVAMNAEALYAAESAGASPDEAAAIAERIAVAEMAHGR